MDFAAISADGSIQTWRYWDQPQEDGEPIAFLTAFFGASPVIAHNAGVCLGDQGADCLQATASWGGFTLIWYPESPDGTRLVATSARVGAVEISSIDGSAVGDDFTTLPDPQTTETGTAAVWVGEVHPPETKEGVSYFVVLASSPPFDTIDSISAPQNNYGY